MNGKAPWIVGAAAALILLVGGSIVLNWVNWVSETLLKTSQTVIEIKSDSRAVKEDVRDLKSDVHELNQKLNDRMIRGGK